MQCVTAKGNAMNVDTTKKRKLMNNTIWYSIGAFSSKAISFFLVPLYTGVLTKSQYSISDLISTTVSLSIPFFSLIISSAVFRYVIEKKSQYEKIFSFGLSIILLGFIPLFVISFLVFKLIDSVAPYWRFFVIIYFITAFSTLESEFLKGQEKVKIVTVVSVIHTLVFVLCNVLFLVFLKLEIRGYFLSYIISGGCSVILFFLLGSIYKYICSPFLVPKELKKKMLSYSLPLIPNSAMWWITNSSDRYFVAFLVSISANGLLSVSYKIPSILSIFIGVFHSAWELSVVDDFENEKGKTFFNSVYQFYLEFNVIIVSFLILFSKALGRILYSGDFFEAWKMSSILILGFSFHAISGFLGSVYTAAKKTKMMFLSTLVAACVNMALNYILIRALGVVGAVIATVVSYFTVFLIRRVSVIKYVDINGNLKKNIISFCFIVVELVLVYMDNKIAFFAAGGIFITLITINRHILQRVTQKVFNRVKMIIN